MNDRELMELLSKALNGGPLEDCEIRAVLGKAVEALEERGEREGWFNPDEGRQR